MSIPDPPWKKRTRPCPFYSQGRCVFAESCGFLHDVKIKSSVDQELTSPLNDGSSRNSMSSFGSIVKPPPAVAVHSPSSPTSTHTPSMTSLLSALQGIIGPLSPVQTEFPVPEGDIRSSLPHDVMQCTGRIPQGNLDNGPVQASQEDVGNASSFPVDDDMPEDPQSNPISPPGLLSPVQIGPVSPFQFPHVALDATLSREGSIDSGYAETWVGPTPFSRSPPQSNQPSSTLDLLSFPFGSPLSRVLPRRYSHTRQSSPPTPRDDSIDLVSPPLSLSTTAHQDTVSSRNSLDSTGLVYATPVQQSPPYSRSPRQEETGDVDQVLDASDLHMALSIGSPAETLFFPAPPSDIPVLHPTSMTSAEDLVDPQFTGYGLPHKDSLNIREGAPSAVEGTVETSPALEHFPSAEPDHDTDNLPSPSSMGTKMASPSHATEPLLSPISLKSTAEVEEFDYEALYQCLIMSPEQAASKRMSWASRLSPPTLPPRAASAGISLSTLVDIPERPHSAVDALPWSRQWGLRVTPVPVSDYTSRTSSPPLETPLSSGSSQAGRFVPSVPVSPVSLPALGTVAHSRSASTPKPSWLPAGIMTPQSAPIPAPSREVTSTLDHRLETDPTGTKWGRVSTSRRVPFGFRGSLVVDKGHSPAVVPRARKRPSALNSLPPYPLIDRHEAPDSARSFASEPPLSKPSWARPLHLSRPSQTGPPIHRSNLHKESLTSAVNMLSGPSRFQRHSPSSSSPQSPHISQHSQVRGSLYSEHYVSNSPTHDALRSAQLHHIEKWHNSPHNHPRSNLYDRRSTSHPPEGMGIDDDTLENGDQLPTFTRGRAPVRTLTPALQRTSSLLSLAAASTTMQERSLMFAIASDDAKSVCDVLEHGHADPNESMGPQSALAFALTNERLAHKLDIVKTLLAYGADPIALRNPTLNPPHRNISISDDPMLLSPPPTTTLEVMDPAMRYYVSRAEAPQTRRISKLLQQSLFRPLGRVRYEIVGQDQVFEQLFTVLNQHSMTHTAAPLVILLCGPSGHGKSFLARRMGSLLHVPTHTVNVTTLRSTHDLWDSYSMSPYEELSTNTLSQFLIENEGKRCVVILDEIEKVEDPKVLYSLLMPWEFGRLSLPTNRRQIDVRQAIWVGTSNIGHDLVFDFCGSSQGTNMTHEEYLELAQLLRPGISHSLGASLSSRVTTILPFVPFTEAELMAIATEAFYSLGGGQAYFVSPNVVERVSRKAIRCYIPEEGARSLHRLVSSLLPEFLEQSST